MTAFTRRRFGKGILGAGIAAALLPDFARYALAQDATGAPVAGGTLNAISTNVPANLDPIFGNSTGADSRFYNVYLEPLVMMDLKGEAHPALAEKWEWSPDGLSLTLSLRKGVVFHDGTSFDAEAAKFNLDRARDPKATNNSSQFFTKISSVDVVDPSTIKITLTEPQASLMGALSAEAGYIVSPTAIKKLGADFSQAPVGTGPFRVTGWSAGQLNAEKFADYWRTDANGKKLPYLDKVTVRGQSNTAVKIVELKGGGAQIIDAIQEKDYPQIKLDPSLILTDTGTGVCQYMSFNCGKPPFDNIELRKAVAHGVNREALAKIVAGSDAVIVNGLGTTWYASNQLKGPTFDVETAKAHYAASGHNGTILLSVIQRDPDTQIAQIIQSMLKEIGITLKIEVLERTAWVEKTLAGNFEMGLQRVGLPVRDPDINFGRYYARDAKQNYARIKNEKIFELVDAARSELDQAKRGDMYLQVQQLILDDYNQYFMYITPQRSAQRVEAQNVNLDAGAAWIFNSIWLKS
jgi:peptide/nickel transport system substrate-binding protein